MSDDRKRWSGWKTVGFVALASAVLWAAIVYVAGQWIPWDTTGEGPKEDNYRW